MNLVLQQWKALFTAEPYPSTEEFSDPVLMAGGALKKRSAMGAEVKLSIANTGTDDTYISIYGAPDATAALRSSVALDAFTLATSGAADPFLYCFWVDFETVMSGWIMGIAASGASTTMEMTASYRLYGN
jgi:hypothetical protein